MAKQNEKQTMVFLSRGLLGIMGLGLPVFISFFLSEFSNLRARVGRTESENAKVIERLESIKQNQLHFYGEVETIKKNQIKILFEIKRNASSK